MNTPFSAASKPMSIKVSSNGERAVALTETEMLVFMMMLTIATSFAVEYVFMD